ncbi:MAG: 3-oxoadipyl-CoA thiolase [Gammaproteobacteria bacterium]|nr:3-oxoadipyl-CoA thiolase [Gammaproteobacteria bacterium]NIR84893.1 3-oxoadipyl-CoA thiolase [Gammaproteobacteria bacterium]NIR91742.1 3-oxoadipyl-CoA thiolase [Gammaproteobacteria bacterium]NIU05940.1 3-oxoadipyl-CoA thiolase [Gammaproteobacteria bacterium]NIV52987.1 3-oxoadipyl-CoA thiolase [Gammaproteobacteria bacterium]
MRDAFVYDALRTPFGRHGGALAAVRPDDLAADLIRTLVARNPFEASAIEDVILGCTNQAGEDCRNVARHVGLLAELPIEVAGVTVNRLCGSGLAAVLDAARCIASNQGVLFVAGGVESMSRAPIAMAKAEAPYSRDVRVYDTTLGARFPNPRFGAAFGTDTLPQTADNIGHEHGIDREESDRFALASQQRYAVARADGFYESELCAVTVPGRGRKDPPRVVGEDEHPRPDTSLDALSKLRPLYPEGLVTAGNASGINDGAAALLIGSRDAGEAAGAQPLARIVSGAAVGVPPRLMGIGPVPASRKALERAGLTLADMDVIEINEAFATQVLGCLKLMDLSYDDSRVNPNGGAIAVGHPLGASGARLALTAVRQLHRTGGRYALVAMCIGVGQGIAAVLERA